MKNQHTSDHRIVIYDTFCGWCFGAAPVFDAIAEAEPDLEVLHCHLFEGASAPRMSAGKGAQILRTIPVIEEMTGRKFSKAFKDNIARSPTEVLESGLSAQAAALVHDQGAAREFALRRRLEDLHFTQGISSTNRQAIVDAVIAEGVDPDDAERIGTPGLEAQAARHSARARALMASVGSRGVPTLLKVSGDQVTQIDHQTLYGRPEAVAPGLAIPA